MPLRRSEDDGRAVLTLLTDPVPAGAYAVGERTRRLLRVARRTIRPEPNFMRSQYRGHFAVTRSLVEGLKRLGVNATYNPSRLACVAPVVGVLSSVRALKQAVEWKRAGRIRRIIAGPNLVNFPTDHESIVAVPEVDVCVTPSHIVQQIYEEDCPALRGRCVIWPAGVDVHYWSPGERRELRAVVYEKPTRWPLESSEPYQALLRDAGYAIDVIRYGSYLPRDYLALLRRASLLIGFASTESQGIAWAEAWAADVPTLLWRRETVEFEHPTRGRRVYPTSSAPYLTQSTGAFFSSIDEFASQLRAIDAGALTFQPREWVEAHMSDEVCARRYLSVAVTQ